MSDNRRMLSLLMAVLGLVSTSMAASGKGQSSGVKNVTGAKRIKNRKARSLDSKEAYVRVGKKTKAMKHGKADGKGQTKTAKTFAIKDESVHAVEKQEGWSTKKKVTVGVPSSVVGVAGVGGAIAKSVSEEKSWAEFSANRAADVRQSNSCEYSRSGRQALLVIETPNSFKKTKNVRYLMKSQYICFYFVDGEGKLKLAYKKVNAGDLVNEKTLYV